MKKDPQDQLKLELGEVEGPPPRPRSKRLRFPGLPTSRTPQQCNTNTAGQALLQSPVVARCGFCGQELTILEDVAVCPSCGSIVSRDEEDPSPK